MFILRSGGIKKSTILQHSHVNNLPLVTPTEIVKRQEEKPDFILYAPFFLLSIWGSKNRVYYSNETNFG